MAYTAVRTHMPMQTHARTCRTSLRSPEPCMRHAAVHHAESMTRSLRPAAEHRSMVSARTMMILATCQPDDSARDNARVATRQHWQLIPTSPDKCTHIRCPCELPRVVAPEACMHDARRTSIQQELGEVHAPAPGRTTHLLAGYIKATSLAPTPSASGNHRIPTAVAYENLRPLTVSV